MTQPSTKRLLTESAGDARYPKRGELVFNVKDYGAKGDGATDDTAAIQSAITAAAAGNGHVLFPPATYVVTSLNVQAGIILDGYGATLKRPANTPNWTRTITNQNNIYVGDADSTRPIVIRGLTLDGNLANQGTYSGFQLEQAMLVMIAGNTTKAGRECAVIEDVSTVNSPSDGIHILANVDAEIRNCRGVDCFRGGLVFSGGNSTVRVTGYKGSGTIEGAHLDTEIDTAGFGGSYTLDLAVSDSRFLGTIRSMQLEAHTGGRVAITNTIINGGLWVYGGDATHGSGSVRITRCTINTYQATFRNQILNPKDVRIEDCDVYSHNTSGAAQAVRAFEVSHNNAGSGVGDNNLQFVDVRFWAGTTVAGDTRTAVYVNAATPADGAVTIRGGAVASTYDTAYQLFSGGKLSVDHRPRIASTFALRISSNSAAPRLCDVTIGQLVLESTCTTYMWVENSVAGTTVTHLNTVIDEARNALATVTGLAGNTYLGNRVILVAAAPTTSTVGLLGDVARIKVPTAGAPFEWVCTSTRAPSSTWKAKASLAA